MIDTGQLKVTARRGSLVLSLPSEVLFPSGVADVSEEGPDRGARGRRSRSSGSPIAAFLVSATPTISRSRAASYKDNWELSTARALTVTRFLVQAGWIRRTWSPPAPASTIRLGKDRAKNRRIEIALLPAINELPPLPASLGMIRQAAGPRPKGRPSPRRQRRPSRPRPSRKASRAVVRGRTHASRWGARTSRRLADRRSQGFETAVIGPLSPRTDVPNVRYPDTLRPSAARSSSASSRCHASSIQRRRRSCPSWPSYR